MSLKKGFFIIGTDTEVGKTYVTCRLLERSRQQGFDAVGMKPVASGMELIDGAMANADIEAIIRASGHAADRSLVNQYCYEPFIAPHLAAGSLGETIELRAIVEAYARMQQLAEIVLVEGAGGLMTPLNQEATYLDLVQQLGLDVILVVAVKLGCINHALLTEEALGQNGIRCAGWVANYAQAGQERDSGVEQSLQDRLDAPFLGITAWQGDLEPASVLNLFK